MVFDRNDERRAYRARWVFPVEGDPLEDATVVVASGRIEEVHQRADPAAENLGNVALIPGLVNAHTHLEFSDLQRPLTPGCSLPDWIRAVVAHRRGRSSDDLESVRCGSEESRAAGTTLLGEIADADVGSAVSLRAVVFRELRGLQPEQCEPALAAAHNHLAAQDDGRIIRGLSPHAPYSVHPDLYHALVELATAHQAPLAVHLAETREELELLDSGTGPFVKMLEDFGVWNPAAFARPRRPLDYLRPLADAPRALVIHGNFLDAEAMDFLARRKNISVVYCPRTHAFFGHPPHPWLRLIERGVNVAVGTDSRASNPDLSVWNELLFLRRTFAAVDPALLLRLGTLHGARALGVSDSGSLATGNSADLTVVELPEDASDPYRALFARRSRVSRSLDP